MKWSFLVACHNCSPYIAKCLDSLLRQTETEWEAIVVDDLSTDDSVEKIEAYVAKDQRFKLFRLEQNQGYGGVLARAIELARGQLCGIVDGDDWLVPEAARLVGRVYDEDPELDYTWSKAHSATERGFVTDGWEVGQPTPDLFRNWAHAYSHWRTFRTLLRDRQQLVDPSIPCAVDKDMALRLDEVGKGRFIEERLYVYRLRSNNISALQRYQQIFYHGVAMERARCRRGLVPGAMGRTWSNP